MEDYTDPRVFNAAPAEAADTNRAIDSIFRRQKPQGYVNDPGAKAVVVGGFLLVPFALIWFGVGSIMEDMERHRVAQQSVAARANPSMAQDVELTRALTVVRNSIKAKPQIKDDVLLGIGIDCSKS